VSARKSSFLARLRLLKGLCLISLCCLAVIASPAQILTTLYSFCSQPNCADGGLPHAGLVQATDGDFYGTTSEGTAYGTLFKITPQGMLAVLHTFGNGDGADPLAGLVQGTDGNFYGTTFNGGINDDPSCVFGGYIGCGTVLKITPGGTLTTLYNFCSQQYCSDGSNPRATLVQSRDGDLYGAAGGQSGGTIFRITPNGTLTTLYYFCSLQNCADGEYALSLLQGADGNFYGTTYAGGTGNNCNSNYYSGCGTVFKMTPDGVLTTLHSFDNTDGCFPEAGLVQGTDGNFYGTTSQGGIGGYCGDLPVGNGTVFKITPDGTLTTLYLFCSLNNCADGSLPWGELVQATDANFYGTTNGGGANGDRGTVFRITPTGTLVTLHSFCSLSNCADGILPYGKLVQAADSNFYGTTYEGGARDAGTVFRLIPQVSTTTVLTSVPNPSNLGQAVTMTATVTARNSSIPTGTVVFNSNGAQIGSASLNNSGVAVLVYSGLPLGIDSLQAVYQGSATLGPSTSNTVLQMVGATMTAVTSTPDPSTLGQEVTITAAVTPGELGGPIPTGTVGFTSNSVAIPGCTDVTLSQSLTAQCATSTLAVGTDVIVATYSGDSNYVGSSGSLVQIVNPVPTSLQFVPVTPCRIVDTRNPNGPFGGPAIQGETYRSFPLAQSGNPCNIPASAVAYSLNVTVVPQHNLGYLTIWPAGEGQPTVSTMNSPDGRIKANAAIVPAGMPSGSVSVYVSNTTNVLLDIDGYFSTPSQGSLQFYPLTPCRVVDTRNGQDQGSLQAGVERDYTIPPTCGVPNNAAAYSFNVTVVPSYGALDYLTVWPQGASRPTVSTLNNKTGTTVANADIVPAGSNNTTAFYAHNNNTDLLLDVDGYFAPPETGGLSLYVVTPCRVLDTRQNNGQPFKGEKTVNVVGSFCAPPSTAQGYVFNATVVPPGAMHYLTLWPDGEGQPTVSTLNARDGFITSNMAIVPTTNGSIDAYASDLTQLILDISSYFAP
jgi:uncharacterized repeat protein (TIGR03803 family)